MSNPMAVLLFDIDGTLLRGAGAGKRAMAKAFHGELAHGVAGLDHVEFHGNTDRAIVREALMAMGSRCSDDDIDRVLAAYVDALAAEVAEACPFRVLAGVLPLLERVAAAPGLAVGLGTGNVRAGARLKVASVGLASYFAFGGYGCDAEARAALLAIGARRGAEHLGVTPGTVPVVVIGDTVRDIRAARAIGASVLAVATGGSTVAELEREAPELLVETLEDPRAVAMLLACGS